MSFSNAIYLDNNVIVALIEGLEADLDGLTAFMESLWRDDRVSVLTSELSFAELLVLPYRNRDLDLIDQYIRLFAEREKLAVVSVGRPILDIAAVLRAGAGRLKLPDAIHLATACACNCKYFLTFDSDFRDLERTPHPFFRDTILPPVKIIRPDPASLSDLTKAFQ